MVLVEVVIIMEAEKKYHKLPSQEPWEKCLKALEANWPHSTLLGEDLSEATKWCEENCKGEWLSFGGRIYIKENKDATFFLLKWA